MNPWANLHPINRIRFRLAFRILTVIAVVFALAYLAADYSAILDDEPSDTLTLTRDAVHIAGSLLIGSLLAYVRVSLIPAWQGLIDLRRHKKADD